MEDAVREAEAALELMPFTRDAVSAIGVHYRAAVILARAGEPERAIEVLELLLDHHSGTTPAELAADPELAPLRDHADFRALNER